MKQKKMPSIILASILFVATVLPTGCFKENYGQCFVTLAPDWSARTEGLDTPSGYIVMTDGYTAGGDGHSQGNLTNPIFTLVPR